MEINIKGRHHQITKAMRDYALKKFAKLQRFDDRITKLEVILSVDGQRSEAESIASASGGTKIVAKEFNLGDMYSAVDLLVDKMEAQLKKHRDKLQDKRGHERLEYTETAEEPDEQSYDQIIDNTEF